MTFTDKLKELVGSASNPPNFHVSAKHPTRIVTGTGFWVAETDPMHKGWTLQENVAELIVHLLNHAEDIVALVEALERIKADAESPQYFYDRNGPQWTSPQGNEYYDASYFLESHNDLAAIASAALQRLEAKP